MRRSRLDPHLSRQLLIVRRTPPRRRDEKGLAALGLKDGPLPRHFMSGHFRHADIEGRDMRLNAFATVLR